MNYSLICLEPVEKGSTPHGFLRNFIKDLDANNTLVMTETDRDYFSVTNNLPLDHYYILDLELKSDEKAEIAKFKEDSLVLEDSLYRIFYTGDVGLRLDCLFIYSTKMNKTVANLWDIAESKNIPVCNLGDPHTWNELALHMREGNLEKFILQNLR